MYGNGRCRARGAIDITMMAHPSPSRIPSRRMSIAGRAHCRLAVSVLYLDCLWAMDEQTQGGCVLMH